MEQYYVIENFGKPPKVLYGHIEDKYVTGMFVTAERKRPVAEMKRVSLLKHMIKSGPYNTYHEAYISAIVKKCVKQYYIEQNKK